ncbi:hypothetical protein [Mycobacterium sp. SMC-4]|uniref:hypothetical protein n=1 Tax=Mycobacterium sp. SMC-4 TaxID=2857059 RepID=UPI0021B1C49C|nr:hypothetical protein [Mycobacterium sp. SMC-4]UXA19511.1 hypothetical protein KXD98_07900 [Mycobacterium sp. SMC-4]
MSLPITHHGEATSPADAARVLADWLAAHTYRWLSEADLQAAMRDVLSERFFTDREKPLSRRDRPDFLVTVGEFTVAVEVKVKAPRAVVIRQLGRYAEHESVDAIVFASGRRSLVPAIPAVIHGKPVVSVFVGSVAL